MARPTIFSKEIADKVCSELIKKGSIRAACSGDDMPSVSVVYNWLSDGNDSDPDEGKRLFLEQYTKAQRISADVEIDGAVEDIMENALMPAIFEGKPIYDADGKPIMTMSGPSVAYARLVFDATKWRAGKKNGKYSDGYAEDDGAKRDPVIIQIVNPNDNSDS